MKKPVKYRGIRVREDIYFKIKAAQLELIRKGRDNIPSMSETIDILITDKQRSEGEQLER